MAHECLSYASSLIVIDYSKGDLGTSRFEDDIASARDDQSLLWRRDQGDVPHKINIQEEGNFLLCEAALRTEEAAVERLGAGPLADAPLRTP